MSVYNFWHGFSTTTTGNMVMGGIPHVVNSRSLMFIAKGKSYTINSDNPNFDEAVRLVLLSSTHGSFTDEEYLIGLTSPKALILSIGGDRLKVENNTLFLDGEAMPQAWYTALLKNQNLARVLLINIGDTIRVEGDEDAPDGEYVVQGVDNNDPENRIYLETEEGFLGFIKSSSIKESSDASP